MLLQKWDSWKGPYQVHLTPDTNTKLQGVEPWMHISQPWKRLPPPDIWSCVNTRDFKIKLIKREVANIDMDCFLPRHQIKKCLSISVPFVTILYLMLIQGRFLSFFCLPFVLPWTRKIMPLLMYLRPLQRRVIQPPNEC